MDATLLIRSWRFWLAAIILGGVLTCSAIIILGTGLSDLSQRPTREALASLTPLREICGGGPGQAEAPGLQDGPGPHPTVLFRSRIAGEDLTAYYIRNDDLPEDWRATTIAVAEMVVCAHAEVVIVEECQYTLENGISAVMQRVQWVSRVVVHDARSGAVLDQGYVEGTLPRECQDSETFSGSLTTQQVAGEHPAPEAIAAWLEPRIVR